MMIVLRTIAHRWRLVSVLMIAGLAVAACGSMPATASTTAAKAGSTAPSTVTVMTKTGAAGTYLVDGSGRSLYLYTPDTTSMSTCTGGCAQIWPPFVTSGPATAGGGVTASMLTTTKQSDGSTQVIYNGHPLYYFAGDTAAGDTKGQGVMNIWFLVAPSGNAIQTK
jgi:predicted lipoprotein with Yx(FWY)xxD motif